MQAARHHDCAQSAALDRRPAWQCESVPVPGMALRSWRPGCGICCDRENPVVGLATTDMEWTRGALPKNSHLCWHLDSPDALSPTVVVAAKVRAGGGMHWRRPGDAAASTTMPASAPAQATEARPARAGAVVLPGQSMATVPAGLEGLQRRGPLAFGPPFFDVQFDCVRTHHAQACMSQQCQCDVAVPTIP